MLQRLVHLLPPKVRAQLRRVPVLVALYRWMRRGRIRERYVLIFLSAVALGMCAGTKWVGQQWFPPSALVLVVLAGGLLLRVRALTALLVVVAAVVAADTAIIDRGFSPGIIVTVGLTTVLALALSRNRQQLGVQGLRGETMLLELRDRLNRQGQIPEIPSPWDSNVELAQAGGSSFGGDFVVSCRHLSPDGERDLLEVALVDVSGKGVAAGTRALMLSGAFGGLLGSVPPEQYLGACNSYLHRQYWDEGFVTAVHVVLDLGTGDYVIESAGHPPAVKFDASAGTWHVGTAKGVVLGVVPDLKCEPESGRLGPGDALMLYTDGLVEQPGRDLDQGIDELLASADRLVAQGFRKGAREIVQSMSAAHDDDCALVLLWRR
ncbi:stage II sporulation protein E [Actinocorallia herbida]|uniref:Stage II sporulation protein E n=1 Tax=Actinocorallia herbida TaxID=58109 RepID=A0A3N1D8U2_9ACTN|nr:PP2C family protein-serine/threonine phosphatase [Actinocorallia herbida]ROO89508.1 stage II sporulation protein E [Actinocorallia herbida]